MANDDDAPISLADVARSFKRANGKSMRLETVHRWWKVGCRGRRLQVQQIGGRYYTTRRWLREFGIVHNPPAAELGAGNCKQSDSRQADQARRFLLRKGFGSGSERNVPRLRARSC